MSVLSLVVRNSAWNLGFRILTAASDALFVVLTARAFGADGRGLYAVAALAGSVLITTLGGTGTAMAMEVAGRATPSSQLNAAAVTIAVVGGGLAGLLATAVALLLGPDGDALLFAAAAGPFLLLHTLQLALFQAEGNVRLMSYTALGASVVPLTALAVFVASGARTIHGALVVWAASQAVAPLVALWYRRETIGVAWRGLRMSLKSLLVRGMPVSAANAIALLNYRVDLIVVATLLPLTEVGRYSVALVVAESLLLVSRALGTGTYARTITMSHERSVELVTSTLRHSLLLLFVLALCLIVAARLFLVPVFGPAFDVWLPLVLLVPGVVAFGAVTEILRTFILVRLGKSRDYLIAAGASMLVNLSLALVLIPPFGLAGAALSTSIAYVAAAFFLVHRFRAHGGPAQALAYVPALQELTAYRAVLGALLRRAD